MSPICLVAVEFLRVRSREANARVSCRDDSHTIDLVVALVALPSGAYRRRKDRRY